jgi:hypothetical protein
MNILSINGKKFTKLAEVPCMNHNLVFFFKKNKFDALNKNHKNVLKNSYIKEKIIQNESIFYLFGVGFDCVGGFLNYE